MNNLKPTPIIWVSGDHWKWTENKKPIVKDGFIGFCGRTKKAFKITTCALTLMVVHDIFIDEKQCEEGGRCLNFRCPLNRKQQSFQYLKEIHKLKKINEDNLNRFTDELVAPEYIDWTKPCIITKKQKGDKNE